MRLAWRAVQMFENDRQELGGDSGFQQVGFLLLMDGSTSAAGDHILKSETAHGAEVKEVTPEEIGELAPQLDLEQVVGGVFKPRSGYADPVRTTQSLVERAREWGLQAYEDLGATGIRLEGDRVVAVETAQGAIETRVVVNAAGPWGRHVGLWVGLNDSVRWSRETDLVLRLPSEFGTFPVVSDPGQRFYFRPQDGDKVVAGLGFPKEIEPVDIDGYDETLDPDSRRRITKPLVRRLPALRSADYLHGLASPGGARARRSGLLRLLRRQRSLLQTGPSHRRGPGRRHRRRNARDRHPGVAPDPLRRGRAPFVGLGCRQSGLTRRLPLGLAIAGPVCH